MSFTSQTKLYTWLSRASDSDVKRLGTMTLHLTDIDLSPLFEASPSLSSSSQRAHSHNAWFLYQQDLGKLDHAMKALTGLTDLTIVPPVQESALVRGMYLTALGIVARRCSDLGCLTLRDDKVILNKVPELKKLSRVVFEGREAVKKESKTVVVKMEMVDDEW